MPSLFFLDDVTFDRPSENVEFSLYYSMSFYPWFFPKYLHIEKWTPNTEFSYSGNWPLKWGHYPLIRAKGRMLIWRGGVQFPFKSFKANILALVRPPIKRIFDIHDPPGIKRLYHLRACLSLLYDHKWHHDFSDTLSNKCVVCNRAENLENYLLNCGRFAYPFRFCSVIKYCCYGNTSLGVVVNRLVIKLLLW